jgi:thiosulfate/3-mercaptopyruvate sulfurtransferase
VVDFGGHIEGSTMMDFSIVRVDRVINGKKVKNLIPSAAVFQKIVQSAGVNNDRHIVLVPFGQKVEDIDEALRIFWQFKVYGQTNISILDGGLTGWLAEGRDVTVSNASKPTGNWTIKGYRKDLVATSDSVARASGTSTSQLIDARDSSVYSGQTKGRVNDRYGYIKGAKNLSPDYLTRSEKGALYFLDKVTYEARLSEAGIESNTSSIIYCENGLFAAGPWFVMSEIVGNQSVKLYDGSLHLWITEGRPLVTTD